MNGSQFKTSLEQLRDQLEKVQNLLIGVAHIDNVYWQIQAIIKENTQINYNSIIYEWITNIYADSIAIRVRRLVDKTKGTISLWRLLEDMKKYNKYFTRDWYLSLHRNGIKHLANKWFDDIAGVGSNHITKKRITSKQTLLKTSFSIVEGYANTRIAHVSKEDSPLIPTFRDSRDAIASIFYISNWCSRLLNSSALHTPVPAIQGNWLSVFNVPWLEESKPIPQYKHLDEIIEEMTKTIKKMENELR